MQFTGIVKLVDVDNVAKKTGKGTYQVAEITYKSDKGDVRSYKVFDFAAPEVFAAVSALEKNDEFTVQAEKNDKGYWDWKEVTKGKAAPAASASKGGMGNASTGTSHADVQVYIVRQNALTNAVAFCGHALKDGFVVEDVLEVARKFEAHVLRPTSDVSALSKDSDKVQQVVKKAAKAVQQEADEFDSEDIPF